MREISTTRTRGMPKALCMSGLVVAGLVIILFAADLAVGDPLPAGERHDGRLAARLRRPARPD